MYPRSRALPLLVACGLGALAAPAAALTLAPGDIVVVDAGRDAAPAQPPRVIRVDPVTGAQALVSEADLLSAPAAVAVAGTETIFVSDSGATAGTGAVLAVDPATGDQTIVEGSFQGLLGLARNRTSGELFVSDAGESAVFGVDPASGGKAPISSGGLLQFPQAIATSSTGILYALSFSTVWRVVRVDPSVPGSQTSVTQGLVQPNGIAVAGTNTIWVVSGGAVVRVDAATGGQTPLAAGSELVEPFGIAVEGANLLVTDWGDESNPAAVVRVDATTGAQTPLASGGLLHQPWAVAVVAPEPSAAWLAIGAALSLGALRRQASAASAQRAAGERSSSS